MEFVAETKALMSNRKAVVANMIHKIGISTKKWRMNICPIPCLWVFNRQFGR